LHGVELLVDLDVNSLKVTSLLDQVFGQFYTSLVVSAVSDIAFPEVEDFGNKVVFEELHTGQNVEHRALECPLGQRKEFSWHGLLARHSFLADFVLHDLDYTSAGDSEVFGVKLLLILFNSEIVRAEFASLDLASVAVEELDGHGDTVLGEEGDSVGAGLDAILHVPDRLALLDEVGFGELLDFVVIGVFLRSDQLVELVVLELFARLRARLDLSVFLVVVVVHLLHLHLHVHAVADLVAVHVV
jgi:hypothetical protein